MKTKSIPIDASPRKIKEIIGSDDVEVWDTQDDYYENGRAFSIRFRSWKKKMDQLFINMEGKVNVASNTTMEFGSSLFYDPVPFEMLKIYATSPQIMVSLNNA